MTMMNPGEESDPIADPRWDCEWCEGKKDCPSFEPTKGYRPGYACTRPAGHDGKHVVCLPFHHCIAEWEVIRTQAAE